MARTSVARAGRGLLKGLLLLVCLAGTAWAQRGAITIPRNLNELTNRADLIVRGTVVRAHVEKHPNFNHLRTVVVTVRVRETLKGPASSTYTFRQFIWDFRDRADAAGYRPGQEFILLMNPPSEYGLTSPAGMEQGRFRIFRDRAGNEVAVNGLGNHGLFLDMETQLSKRGVSLSPRLSSVVRGQKGGPMAVGDLRDLILELRSKQSQ